MEILTFTVCNLDLDYLLITTYMLGFGKKKKKKLQQIYSM